MITNRFEASIEAESIEMQTCHRRPQSLKYQVSRHPLASWTAATVAAIPDIHVAEGECVSINAMDNTTVPVQGDKEMVDTKTHPGLSQYNTQYLKTIEVVECS